MPLPLIWNRWLPFGRRAEIDGAGYLRSLGFRIAASGYRTRTGEVDLIAWEADQLVFVEVKARQSGDPPEDAVGPRKQRRIASAARAYIRRYKLQDHPYRFDILAVTALHGAPTEFRLLRDAFRPPPASRRF